MLNKSDDIAFGALDFNLTVDSYWKESWNKKALLNIGDASEYLVIEQLLREIGIPENMIVKLSIKDLTRYKGKKLIVPLNIAFDSYVGYNQIFDHLSEDIIPVFLGISLTKPNLNENQLNCLRTFAPIGCRDERSYRYLKSKKISCYLNGCTASIIDLEKLVSKKSCEDRVLFIDVPRKVKDYIPEYIKKDIVFLNQELYCNKNNFNFSNPLNWAEEVFSYYIKPRMIVTSRFHGAVLGLANGIPVILTLENYTFRFSWLKNYIPIYTEKDYNKINWKIKSSDYSKTKNIIKKMAVDRILSVYNQYRMSLQLTKLQILSKGMDLDSSNQVLYCDDVIQSISSKWDKNQKIEYGLWGINDNSIKIKEFIDKNYPNAVLRDVYDMYQKVSFNGLESHSPKNIIKQKNNQNYYVIVTAYLASRVALDVLGINDFDSDRLFLCTREFVEKKHL